MMREIFEAEILFLISPVRPVGWVTKLCLNDSDGQRGDERRLL